MKNETQINELAVKFAEFVNEDYCRGCDESDVVRTTETAQQFIDACREYRKLDNDEFEGMTVTIIEESQRFKNEPRKDVFILDAGNDDRLVIAL
ncbi:MAG: hypothetical protein DRP56_02060 [Planctomycetota bacterium]|nr:MAG: hypothetical protein DRP56_02060 [Planctomycetota bacterium]